MELIIEPGAIVEPRTIDEVNRYAFIRLQGEYLRLHPVATERHVQVIIKPLELRELLAYSAVERRDDPDRVPCPPQRFGQSADHIRQPAAFGIGMNLAAGQEKPHDRSFHPFELTIQL